MKTGSRIKCGMTEEDEILRWTQNDKKGMRFFDGLRMTILI